jgi:hypothetical protein
MRRGFFSSSVPQRRFDRVHHQEAANLMRAPPPVGAAGSRAHSDIDLDGFPTDANHLFNRAAEGCLIDARMSVGWLAHLIAELGPFSSPMQFALPWFLR